MKLLTDTSEPIAHEPNAARILLALRTIVRALRVESRSLEMRHGVSLAQVIALQHLERWPAASLNDLATRTMTHPSSVSIVVRQLAERGFVTCTRNRVDRRVMEIAITETGSAFLSSIPVLVENRLSDALSRLTDPDSDRIARLLDGLVDAIPADSAMTPTCSRAVVGP